MSEACEEVIREVAITHREGLHARPVMRFVDLASSFKSNIHVTNVSRRPERVDGKSAMQMMLLEATQGSVLRIEAVGKDAAAAISALVALVTRNFDMAENPPGD